MDYTCCWDCGFQLSVRGYAICTLIAFDVALVVYRGWQLSQVDFPRHFSLRPPRTKPLR